MKKIQTIIGALMLISICIAPTLSSAKDLEPGLYAQMDTTKGIIVLKLFYKKVPMTVINFTGLADGKFKTTRGEGVKYYDGLTFHRVIKGFMIQGGDPKGNGSGGPGYNFPDEFVPELRHDSAGILSMANAGPGTNGSQFFITHAPTPWLDDKHTVFGKVVSGMNVVNAIEQGDMIKRVTILRMGKDAQSFKNTQDDFQSIQKDIQQTRLDQFKETFEKKMLQRHPEAKTLKPGMMVVTLKEGEGSKPAFGDTVLAHVTNMFVEGQVIKTTKDTDPHPVVIDDKNIYAQTLGTMSKGGVKRLLISHMILGGQFQQMKMDLVIELELVDIKK